MSSNFVHIWVGVLIVVHLAALPIRTMRGRKSFNNEDFIVTGFELGGAISLIKIIIQLLTQEKLQTDLGFDGSLGLLLGSSSGIYFTLRDVYIRLF
jgi:hypothetical protein